MSNKPEPQTIPNQPVTYQIKLKGHLSGQWTDWFDGLTVMLGADGNTLLAGPVRDQAALFGLLKKIRNLGLTLVSVNPVDTSTKE